jgi:outer membrane receptor for ferric coprogen and ferric-rhodotorulic acid
MSFSRPHAAGAQRRARSMSSVQRPPRKLLAIALQGILLGVATGAATIPQAARAQTETALPAGDEVRAFDIPAGPLETALDRYARSAGVNLTYDPELVKGLQSPGVSGSRTLAAALGMLLAGTGLEAVAQPGGGYSLRRAPASDQSEMTLPAVTVTGATARSGADVTEGSGSYTARATTSVTKLPLTLRETPQTVTVVTRQSMDDFNMHSINDVLSSTSGVFVYTRGGNGSFYYSRGFFMQSQYDGIPLIYGMSEWNRNPPPDSAIFDRVDVLQGASGLLNGAGDPGGTVNMVRKQPTPEFQLSGEAGLGSWDGKRVMADVSGPLAASGAVRGRAVVAFDDRDSFIDHAFARKHVYYGVLEADVARDTLLSASAQIQNNDERTHYGVPMAPDGSDLDLGSSTFFGAKWGTEEKETRLYTLKLDQGLANDWAFRAAYMHGDTSVAGWQVYTYTGLAGVLDPVTGDGLDLNYSDIEREFDSDAVDLYLTGPVELFGRRHDLVFGANGSRLKGDYRNAFDASPINIYTYRYDSIPQPTTPLSPWQEDDYIKQSGFFAAGRFSLSDPLKLIVGARVTSYEDNYGGKENGVVSPYAGLVYELNDWSSVYASYSDIFLPQTSRQKNGSTIDPVVGSNYEAGVKGEFYEGRLNTSLAVFRLEQTNLAKEDPSVPFDPDNICGGFCYTASDMVVSQGVDVGVNGELSPGWQALAGYTYVERKYGKGALDGEAYGTDQPRQILRLSTLYRLPETKWSVGGDTRVQSKIYQKDVGFKVEQGGIALVGLTAKYALTDKSELSLQVENLFDREYYETIGYPEYGNFYGEPRNFWVTYRQTL